MKLKNYFHVKFVKVRKHLDPVDTCSLSVLFIVILLVVILSLVGLITHFLDMYRG